MSLLTNSEMETLKVWEYNTEDNSVVSQHLLPAWKYLATLVPIFISPNIISTLGFLLQVIALHIVYKFYEIYPSTIIWAVVLLHITYMFLDSINGIHSRNTGTSSPMGELIDHGLDSCGTLCQTLTFCYIFGITDNTILWYISQSSLMIFQLCHIRALTTCVVKLGRYTGPCELIVMYCTILILKALDIISNVPFVYFTGLYQYVYYIILCYMLFNALTLNQKYNIVVLLITYSGFFAHSILPYNITLLTVFASGLVMCAVTCDLIVSKMAKKNLSFWIIPIVAISLLYDIFGIIASSTIMISYILEISRYLELNIFQTNRTCYVSGISGAFEMLHSSHVKLFHNPQGETLTYIDKAHAVEIHRYMYTIIPHAPVTINEEFIKKWNIPVYVHPGLYYNTWYYMSQKIASYIHQGNPLLLKNQSDLLDQFNKELIDLRPYRPCWLYKVC